MKKIAFITASPETISSFLTAYIDKLCEQHEVHVVTTMGNTKSIRALTPKAIVHDIHISRAPDIVNDIKSLYKLYKLFRLQRFDMVHSVTPKAGLLTQLASYFAGTKLRFHTFTGQVWATKTGFGRFFLKTLDKVTAKLATHCLVDSPSQKQFLLSENVSTPSNLSVLSKGSISGVNTTKFAFSDAIRAKLREEHGLSDSDFAMLFVGRLNREKGIYELLEAFEQVSKEYSPKLFILGSDEEDVSKSFLGNDNIHYLGFKPNVSDYYSFAEVLVLPSHREGFGNVVIEAASCNLPTVASNIYGLSDAVEDGHTGLLHQVKCPTDLASKLRDLLHSPEKLSKFRTDARRRVVNDFDEGILIQALLDFYKQYGIK